LPTIDSQIFGPGFRSSSRQGWIHVEGDVPQVIGFFLAFNGTMTTLDGADVSSARLESFLFTEADRHGQILVANPNYDAVTVNLELVGADGAVIGGASRKINANGAFAESIESVFAGADLGQTHYVRGRATAGVIPLEYLGGSAGDAAALNGQDPSAGATTVYSPQFVAGGTGWRAAISIVNLSPRPGKATLTFIGDDGLQIGTPRVLEMAPGSKIRIDDPNFFLTAGENLRQGYVQIVTDGIKLVGDVVFGNPGTPPFSTSLALVATPRSDMVFSQVASNETFFTGLAIVNPNEEAATATLTVHDSAGAAVASSVVNIPARGRLSKLATQYFPELQGKNVGSGYISLYSVRSNLVAFALFGANNLSVLSAVPAQVVP
jgi:hypothetical protein